jgi:hypothetical protein
MSSTAIASSNVPVTTFTVTLGPGWKNESLAKLDTQVAKVARLVSVLLPHSLIRDASSGAGTLKVAVSSATVYLGVELNPQADSSGWIFSTTTAKLPEPGWWYVTYVPPLVSVPLPLPTGSTVLEI